MSWRKSMRRGARLDGSVSEPGAPVPPSLRAAAAPVALFVLGLWGIWAAQRARDLDLYRLGVYPRELSGLIGIVTGPLIHASWQHLVANTPPLLILGTALRYGYPRAAPWVMAGVWLGSGLGVWLFGRASYHIGASGLSHGLLFFLSVVGVLRRDRRSVALALVVFFLYGGMVATVLPQGPAISFESHLSGALTGFLLAFLLRWRDPPLPERRYSWEDEASDRGDGGTLGAEASGAMTDDGESRAEGRPPEGAERER